MKLMVDIPEDIYKRMKNGDLPIYMAYRYLKNGTPLPNCKECKSFEYDSVAKVDGISLIVAHEICKRWGDGCKTKEDGYCFLFEPQESEEE